MDNTLAELAYQASVRSLDKQEQSLNELRARTGILLAASSLAVSFLGQGALANGEPAVKVLAVGAFLTSMAAGLYVLIPRRQLSFDLGGRAVYERLFPYRENRGELYRRLAYDLDRFWEANDVRVLPLVRAFRVAAGALAVEIVLLVALSSGTLS